MAHLWFDVDGAGVVLDAGVMRQRPTIVLLKASPRFDHFMFHTTHATLTNNAQIIYWTTE